MIGGKSRRSIEGADATTVSAASTTLATAASTTLVIAGVVAIVLEAIAWTITRVFVLNFSTAGPNATAALFLLLATGWCLVPIAVVDPAPRTVLVASAIGLAVGVGGSFARDPIVAGIGGVVAVTAATPLLVAFLDERRERIAIGVGCGVLAFAGLRTALAGASAYATRSGRLVLAAGALGVCAVVVARARCDALPDPDWRALRVSPAPIGATLLVAAIYLASPHAVSRWALRPLWATGLSLAVGTIVGAAIASARGVPSRVELGGWTIAYGAGVAAVLYTSYPATTLAFGIAWAGAIGLLAAGSRRIETPGGSRGIELTLVQAVALLCAFWYVSAGNWAFMPAPIDELARGRATLSLAALHATLPLSVWLASVRTDPTTGAVDRSRRSAIAAVGASALPLAGTSLRSRDFPAPIASAGSTDDRDGPATERFRAATYNVHQYFDDAGAYNLEAIADVVAETDAALVGLTESEGCRITSGNVDGVDWLARRLGYRASYGAATARQSYGVALLSRWPIEDERVVELPVERSPPRIALAATVRTPNGPLGVIVTHFMTAKPGDVRDRQAETIVDLASEWDRAIVLGDFNVEPSREEPAYRLLADELGDAWLAADDRRGTPGTYPADDPRRRIDYVFVRGDWRVRSAETLGDEGVSDHRAVVAELATE